MQHILVVDDDADITQLLAQYLSRFGFTAHTARDADSMRMVLAAQPVDLVVLDVMLPGTDGLALARELRSRSRIPIIMLTARGDPYDRVIGLEMGADDYMSKPFEPRELVARIQTVLRRITSGQAPPPEESEVVHFDGWQLHRMARHLITPEGVVTPLSNAEFRLLCTFLSMPRRICSRDQLMEDARGRSMEVFERSIDLLVSRLRQKLGDDPREPRFIKTVRGAGYLFNVRNVQGGLGGCALLCGPDRAPGAGRAGHGPGAGTPALAGGRQHRVPRSQPGFQSTADHVAAAPAGARPGGGLGVARSAHPAHPVAPARRAPARRRRPQPVPARHCRDGRLDHHHAGPPARRGRARAAGVDGYQGPGRQPGR